MKFYERKRRMPTVIIVALIDIFVILLIFVIVTTTFRRPQTAVTIRLPESTTAQPRAQEANVATLTVSPEGGVTLDDHPVTMEELPGKIRAIVEEGRPLALRADTQAPFGTIVRVLDALKTGGASGNLPAFTETISK